MKQESEDAWISKIGGKTYELEKIPGGGGNAAEIG